MAITRLSGLTQSPYIEEARRTIADQGEKIVIEAIEKSLNSIQSIAFSAIAVLAFRLIRNIHPITHPFIFLVNLLTIVLIRDISIVAKNIQNLISPDQNQNYATSQWIAKNVVKNTWVAHHGEEPLAKLLNQEMITSVNDSKV